MNIKNIKLDIGMLLREAQNLSSKVNMLPDNIASQEDLEEVDGLLSNVSDIAEAILIDSEELE